MVYSYKDQEPIVPFGEALLSFGLEVRDGISGFGQLTRGLLWEYSNIWIDIDAAAPISTSWQSADTSITTSWTSSDASLVTTWTVPFEGEPSE